MGRAPGSRGLLALCDAPVLPTPAAVGAMVQMLASGRRGDVLAVDVGGATTDVFSVVGGRFSRTVSANLGLSYSILQVWQEVGPERIARWLPDPPPAWMMHDRIANKMLRPTVVPASPEALALEQAVAREALALALATHGEAIRRTAGRRRDRDVGEAFGAAVAGDGLDLSRVELIVASGGVLSRAPRAEQAALVLIDALQPVGVTELLLDAAYILPHLGVLAVEAPAAAAEALEAALVPLACCVAPRTADRPAGAPLLRCRLEAEGGALREHLLRAGELARWPLEPRSRGLLRLLPERGVDAGAGPGRSVEQPVHGGVAGVILDGRGRPLILPEAAEERSARLRAWRRALACEPGSSS